MPVAIYIIPPLVGAFVGFITNVIAVELLFHPKKPVNILGLKIQGLVPARSKDIIQRFMDSLNEILNEDDFEFLIDRALTKAYNDSLKEKVSKSLSYLNYFSVSKKIEEWLHSAIVPYFKDLLTKNISKNVDVQEFILKKAEEVSDEQIEYLFKRFARKELQFIKFSGAVIGLIIGLLQSALLLLLELSLIHI